MLPHPDLRPRPYVTQYQYSHSPDCPAQTWHLGDRSCSSFWAIYVRAVGKVVCQLGLIPHQATRIEANLWTAPTSHFYGNGQPSLMRWCGGFFLWPIFRAKVFSSNLTFSTDEWILSCMEIFKARKWGQDNLIFPPSWISLFFLNWVGRYWCPED